MAIYDELYLIFKCHDCGLAAERCGGVTGQGNARVQTYNCDKSDGNTVRALVSFWSIASKHNEQVLDSSPKEGDVSVFLFVPASIVGADDLCSLNSMQKNSVLGDGIGFLVKAVPEGLACMAL